MRPGDNQFVLLLVKYMELPTEAFVCPGDKGTAPFELGDLACVAGFELSDAWDFGPPAKAFTRCSYAYHMPFDPCALTTARDRNFAVFVGMTMQIKP